MKKTNWLVLIFTIGLLPLLPAFVCVHHPARTILSGNSKDRLNIPLPSPLFKSNTSVEEALLKRRSVRRYKNQQLSLKETAQLLWAAQGITKSDGKRTAPSAGALYPLEIYLVSENVESLNPGIYHYQPSDHSLQLIKEGSAQNALKLAASLQGSVNRGSAVIVITAVYERTTRKYGERGIRFVHLEAGHAAQNICLQAVSLQVGTVTVGAFSDSQVSSIMGLPEGETPLYLMPIGKIDPD